MKKIAARMLLVIVAIIFSPLAAMALLGVASLASIIWAWDNAQWNNQITKEIT